MRITLWKSTRKCSLNYLTDTWHLKFLFKSSSNPQSKSKFQIIKHLVIRTLKPKPYVLVSTRQQNILTILVLFLLSFNYKISITKSSLKAPFTKVNFKNSFFLFFISHQNYILFLFYTLLLFKLICLHILCFISVSCEFVKIYMCI